MIRSLLICGLLMASAGAAIAQDTAPPTEELLALNFFVEQQDQAAIDAEMRRLQLKYPYWQPPEDLARLAMTGPSTEIDEIFRLIAAQDFNAARAMIAAAQAEFPAWEPPAEMIALLETGEGQARFDSALAAGNLNQAISVASSVPGLLRCDRINNAWRIGEAQVAAGRDADALGTYTAVAGTCTSPADLIATLEKADAVASEEQILALIAQVGQRIPAMEPQLEVLRQKLLAGRGQVATIPDVAEKAPTPSPEAGKKPNAPPAPAAPTASAAPPAGAAPAPSGGGGGGGFKAAVNAGDWSRCLALSAGSRAASVMYQRGWCAFNLDQPMEAVATFQAALKAGLNGEQRRDAAYGIALAYLKMGMKEDASRIAAATDFTRKQRVDIERPILDQRGVNAYKRKDYRKAIAYFDALEQLTGGIRRDLAVLRAYAWLNAGNRAEARRQFEKLNNELSTDETRRGLRATKGE